MANPNDWNWRVEVTPPPRYAELAFEDAAFASGDLDDPLLIARLIGRHVANVFTNRLFEEAEETPGA